MTIIKVRRGTASQWNTANTVLAAGEQGIESDTSKVKYGDGTSAWSALSYFNNGSAARPPRVFYVEDYETTAGANTQPAVLLAVAAAHAASTSDLKIVRFREAATYTFYSSYSQTGVTVYCVDIHGDNIWIDLNHATIICDINTPNLFVFMFNAAGRTGGSNPSNYTNWATRDTQYRITPSIKGSHTITCNTPSDASHFAVDDWILIRAGQMVPSIGVGDDQPDGEPNRVKAVNATTGVITLRWPTAKPYRQEWRAVGQDAVGGYTSLTNTGLTTMYPGVANVNAKWGQNVRIYNGVINAQYSVAWAFFLHYYDCAANDLSGVMDGYPALGQIFRKFRSADITARRLDTAGPSGSIIAGNATCGVDSIQERFYVSGTASQIHLHEGTAQNTIRDFTMMFDDTSADAGGIGITVIGRSYDNVVENGLIYGGGYGPNITIASDCVDGGTIRDVKIVNPTASYVVVCAGVGWVLDNVDTNGSAVSVSAANQWVTPQNRVVANSLGQISSNQLPSNVKNHYGLAAVFSGSYTDFISTPDSSANSVTGNLEIRVKLGAGTNCRPPSFNQGMFISKWGLTTGSYMFGILSNGALLLYWTPDGTTLKVAGSAVLPSVLTNDLWVRFRLNINNGSSGWTVNFETSTDKITWAALGGATTGTPVTSVYNGTDPVRIGGLGVSNSNVFSGSVIAAEIANSIGGATTTGGAAVNAFAWTDPTATTYTATTGEVWTINGSVPFTLGDLTTSFLTAADRTALGGSSAAPVDGAAGVPSLRTLGTATTNAYTGSAGAANAAAIAANTTSITTNAAGLVAQKDISGVAHFRNRMLDVRHGSFHVPVLAVVGDSTSEGTSIISKRFFRWIDQLTSRLRADYGGHLQYVSASSGTFPALTYAGGDVPWRWDVTATGSGSSVGLAGKSAVVNNNGGAGYVEFDWLGDIITVVYATTPGASATPYVVKVDGVTQSTPITAQATPGTTGNRFSYGSTDDFGPHTLRIEVPAGAFTIEGVITSDGVNYGFGVPFNGVWVEEATRGGISLNQFYTNTGWDSCWQGRPIDQFIINLGINDVAGGGVVTAARSPAQLQSDLVGYCTRLMSRTSIAQCGFLLVVMPNLTAPIYGTMWTDAFRNAAALLAAQSPPIKATVLLLSDYVNPGDWLSGTNAVQTITLGSGVTSYTVTFVGGTTTTTASISSTATASTVRTALWGASSISTNNVFVTGNAGGPYTVTFVAALGNAPQTTMTATGTGGTVTVTSATTGVVGSATALTGDGTHPTDLGGVVMGDIIHRFLDPTLRARPPTPRTISITPGMLPERRVNWPEVIYNPGSGLELVDNPPNTATVSDRRHRVWLTSGDYTAFVKYDVGPDLGIMQIRLDFAQMGTNIDCYNASFLSQNTTRAITITTAGYHYLTIRKLATKNASSTGYGIHFAGLELRRTSTPN